MRHFIDTLLVHIPSDCPFARKVYIGSHYLFTVPPLCKLNPFYNQIMMAKFHAMERLAAH